MGEVGRLAAGSCFLCSWFVSSVLGVPCAFLWASLQGPPGVLPFSGLQGPGNTASFALFVSTSQFLLLLLVLPTTCSGIRNVFGGVDASPPHHTPTRGSAAHGCFRPSSCCLLSGWISDLVPRPVGIRVGGPRGLAVCTYSSDV